MITLAPTPLPIRSLEDAVCYDVDLSDLDDQRTSPRVPVFSRVEISDQSLRPVRARDISLGGMRVLSRDGGLAHRAGSPVEIRFRLPGEAQLVAAVAKVVSLADAGNDLALGLRFERLTKHGMLTIYRLVTDRARDIIQPIAA